jgi:hypothetical protein
MQLCSTKQCLMKYHETIITTGMAAAPCSMQSDDERANGADLENL